MDEKAGIWPKDWLDQTSREDLKRLFVVAKPLIDVGNGERVRRIIDAVRDAIYATDGRWPFPHHTVDLVWRAAMDKLTSVAGGDFQSWDRGPGRTHEDRLAFMDRAISASNDWRSD